MAEEPQKPTTPNADTPHGQQPDPATPGSNNPSVVSTSTHGEPVSYTVEDRPDDYHASRYGAPETSSGSSSSSALRTDLPVVRSSQPPPPSSPPPKAADDDEDDEEEDGMLRMSFLEHLEELRSG